MTFSKAPCRGTHLPSSTQQAIQAPVSTHQRKCCHALQTPDTPADW
ncbi:hypothetical protein [Rhabdochromatium marinum]|nr:hypothetical protein [Rhabdochromatium marinum]